MYMMSGMGATPTAEETCELACYETKSKAYQVCQQIPLDKRKAKVACFREADAVLSGCLSKCSSPSGATIAMVAGVGLLAHALLT